MLSDGDVVSSASLYQHVGEIESQVRQAFCRRLHDFHIVLIDDGVELEGRCKTYHVKQVVQQAVIDTTHLRIRTNNIVVDLPPQSQ